MKMLLYILSYFIIFYILARSKTALGGSAHSHLAPKPSKNFNLALCAPHIPPNIPDASDLHPPHRSMKIEFVNNYSLKLL